MSASPRIGCSAASDDVDSRRDRRAPHPGQRVSATIVGFGVLRPEPDVSEDSHEREIQATTPPIARARSDDAGRAAVPEPQTQRVPHHALALTHYPWASRACSLHCTWCAVWLVGEDDGEDVTMRLCSSSCVGKCTHTSHDEWVTQLTSHGAGDDRAMNRVPTSSR